MKKVYTVLKPFIVGLALGSAVVLSNALHDGDVLSTVRAFGDLAVQFGIPAEEPLFSLDNMAPGDTVSKEIQVTNNGTTAHFVAVKGVRTGPPEEDSNPALQEPLIETVLQLTISENASTLFQGTLQEFFDMSQSENGVPLSVLGAAEDTTYTMFVEFPTTAGNEFQGKSVIFDLIFGTNTTELSMVINEVYYEVDESKGYDSPKDRGIDAIGGSSISVIISDNGAGSVNTVNIALKEVCKITQGNNVNITNVVNQSGNTGGNTNSGNTGSTTTQTGFISQLINLINFGGVNVASCGKKLDQNHEWIELYNATDEKISLKDWTLTDSSGVSVELKNKKIKPGEYVLITKDSSTWKFWNEHKDAVIMNLGDQIGDGLDNDGDRLILKDASGQIVDYVAWGNDMAIWNPAVPLVVQGASIERNTPGFDTDSPSDWSEQLPPTPGQ